MATKSASAHFPFQEDYENKSILRSITVVDTIKSAIACFLLTTPGQRRGNPIGSFLPGLKHKLIPVSSLPTVSNELKVELTKQFPGVTFVDVVVTQDKSDQVITLSVNIVFGTAISDLSQLELII